MNILDLNAGYTNCDICGNGNTTIRVEATRESYTYRHRSNCYGNLERTGLTKEELLELLDKHSFLPHTRHAVKAFKEFRRDVARGAFERLIKPVEEKPKSKVYFAPAEERLDPVNITATQVGEWAQVAVEQMLTHNFAYANALEEWERELLEGGM